MPQTHVSALGSQPASAQTPALLCSEGRGPLSSTAARDGGGELSGTQSEGSGRTPLQVKEVGNAIRARA